MASFIGTYSRNIDDKQRLPLPREFRDVLGGDDAVVTRTGGALTLHLGERFEDMLQRLEEEVRAGTQDEALLQHIAGGAYRVRPDAQNRIKIPKQILEDDEMRGELVLFGTGSRLEIRTPERHAEVRAAVAALPPDKQDYR